MVPGQHSLSFIIGRQFKPANRSVGTVSFKACKYFYLHGLATSAVSYFTLSHFFVSSLSACARAASESCLSVLFRFTLPLFISFAIHRGNFHIPGYELC